MARSLNDFLNKLKSCTQLAMIDSCNEIAQGVMETAQGRADLDPNEVSYSIYKGYDNVGEFATYKDSFKVKDAQLKGNQVNAKAYNDYLVYFKRVGGNVPYGNFIEWGTGTAGGGAPAGFDYTLTPWDERTKQQSLDMNTFGMVANPHWTIAYYQYNAKKKDIYMKNWSKYK